MERIEDPMVLVGTGEANEGVGAVRGVALVKRRHDRCLGVRLYWEDEMK